MIIDNIKFDTYKIKSVKLDLDNCMIFIKVMFTKGEQEFVLAKEYEYQTNCDVNINEYIVQLEKKLNAESDFC